MIIENIKIALSALIANKMRSFLTMLGIIIGIGSVIAITSLGDTVRKIFSDLFQGVGANQAYIYIMANDGEYRESDSFTNEELDHYVELFQDKIAYIDQAYNASGDVKTRLSTTKISISGVDYNYDKMQKNLHMVHGRFLSKNDITEGRYNVVIDEDAAIKMFGITNVVGRSFRMTFYGNDTEFLVVGVYRTENTTLQKLILSTGRSSYEIYAPKSIFYSANGGSSGAMRFFGNAELSNADFKKLTADIQNYISRTKERAISEVNVSSAVEQMQQVDSFFSVISIVMGSIAGISLLVGGIGIMNIMLVSVTERTREIGIRKALGATTKDILIQFLIESAFLSAIGGMLGVLIAVTILSAAGAAFSQPIVVKPMAVVLSVGFSAFVGIFFGIFPAKKAASKNPIEALRYE